MRLLVQRCDRAHVCVDDVIVGSIQKGLLLFVGICQEDNEEDIDLLIQKLIHLRIFSDENGKVNLSLLDIGGEVLSISQYSLYAEYKKGRRPSFTQNASVAEAKRLYGLFNDKLSFYVKVDTGVFQADMKVSLINDGPFTMILDSKELKK